MVSIKNLKAISARQDLKDLILDAAERLLALSGYKKLTMEEIAKEVGIGKGTIYLHYDSKEALILAHIDRIVHRLKGRLFAIAHSNGSGSERIRKMLLLRVLFRFDDIQHYAKGLGELLVAIHPALVERRQRYFEEEAQIVAEVLREGERAGEFEFADSVATAHVLVAATNSFLPFDLSVNELGSRKELERKTQAVADLLIRGLVKSK